MKIELSTRNVFAVLTGVIVAGLLLRGYGLFGDILGHHFLRQVDTAALARNFADEGMNFLLPRVDWRGASTGYVESEFPLYSYAVAALHRLFGGGHVEFGRLLNLVFYVLTALTLFDFARRMFDAPRALLAVFFYCFNPLTSYFAHSLQPDTVMLLATLAAVSFFQRWCDSGRILDFAVSAVAIAVAILIKPQNLYLGAPLFFLCFQRFGWRLFAQPLLWVYGAAALLPAFFWYRHAYELWVEHGNTLFRPYSDLANNVLWSAVFPGKLVGLHETSYASELAWRAMAYFAVIGGIVPFFVGVRAAIVERNVLLLTWAGAFAVTMIVFAAPHYLHEYYQMPLVLVGALLLADGTARLWRGEAFPRLLAAGLLALYVLIELWLRLHWQRETLNQSGVWLAFFIVGALIIPAFAAPLRVRPPVIGAALATVAAFSVWTMVRFSTPAPWAEERVAFGAELERLTQPEDRIVIAQNVERPGWFQHRTAQGELLGYWPVDFYFSRRKGWSVSGEHASPDFLEVLRSRGATHFAAWCCEWGGQDIRIELPALAAYLECAHTPLNTGERYLIYRLDEPRRRPDGSSCLPS